MALSLLEEQPDDVDLQLLGWRNADATWPRRARRRLPDAEGGALTYGGDPRDGCVAIQNGDDLAAPDGAQMLAEPRLELRYTHLFHGHMMTRSGQHRKHRARETAPASAYRRSSVSVPSDGPCFAVAKRSVT